MKVIRIEKKDWEDGLERSGDSYRLMGPVKGENRSASEFRELKKVLLGPKFLTDSVTSLTTSINLVDSAEDIHEN